MVLSLKYRYIIVFGVVIRLVLLPFFAHPFDMYAWYRYGEEVLRQGVSVSMIGITPFWNFWLILVAYIHNWLSIILHISVVPVSTLPSNFNPSYGITVVTDPLFNMLVKTPLILADVFSALLIYKISRFYSGDHSIARHSAFLYFFSPIVIWISAAWGQYDPLAVLFTLLSFYLLLVSKKIISASLSLYMAILIKIYPIIFLVPILVSLLRFETDRLRKAAFFLLPLIPLSLYLLLFHADDLFSFLKGLMFPDGLAFASGFGLTYWSVSLIMSVDILWSKLIMNLVTVSLISLSLYYIIKRAKTQFDVVLFGAFLFTAALFLSLTVVSEQRSIILLALLSLIMVHRPSLRIYFLFFSFDAFLYAQKNFPFYLLPLASIFPDSFSFLFSAVFPFINRSSDFIAPTFNSGFALFIIGASFSSVLSILVYKIFRNKHLK